MLRQRRSVVAEALDEGTALSATLCDEVDEGDEVDEALDDLCDFDFGDCVTEAFEADEVDVGAELESVVSVALLDFE